MGGHVKGVGQVVVSWSPQAESLWAKTGEAPEEWLPLVRHLMDAADLAPLVWDRWLPPGVRAGLESELDLRGDGAKLVAWLAGVHDVGKASAEFQAQLMRRPGMESFADRVVDAGLPLRGPASMSEWLPHSVFSAAAITRWLPGRFPLVTRRKAGRLAAVAGAHHGLPARRRAITKAGAFLAAPWAAVQDELLDGLTAYTGAEAVLERLPELGRHHQMQLTAVVIMADWIASNQELFPLDVHQDRSSVERAHRAWRQLDLAGVWTTRALPERGADAYADRFGWPEHRRPWPVQEEVFTAASVMDGAGLLCIEAPMGVGKTEAALLAADVLARRTGRHGIMVAAPTMATSDALFARVQAWAERAGSGVVPASMFLAHSKASLNEDARSLPARGLGVRAVGEDEVRGRGAVVAHQWLVGRKKGLLANIAVGTVDQVLFMALQSKHVMLRHLALSSKVVVIDEVHAYDAYMSQYLGRALHWLGVYRTPVILLSATLPHEAKAQLVAAYQSGLRGAQVAPDEVPDTGDHYPVLTVADGQGITSVRTGPSGRRLQMRIAPMEDDDATLTAAFSSVAAGGGCLLVVCSTVARAQHAYMLAKEIVGTDARLLHARFTSADRLERERELIGELGPGARVGAGRPERRVVVATQVVEQSLDLDFDAMITDIAPVDLLLQRCGRVHRHERPATERPEWARDPLIRVRGMARRGTAETPPEFEVTQELVYPEAALMASVSTLELFDAGATVTFPADIPILVGRAYGADPGLPAAWSEAWGVARTQWNGLCEEQRSRAQSFLLPTPKSHRDFERLWPTDSGDVDSLDGEAQGLAQVRDADPMIEVLLTRDVPGGYTPLAVTGLDEVLADGQAPPWASAMAIAASAVRLPRKFAQPGTLEKTLDELESVTDAAWQNSALLKGQLQLRLDHDGRATLAGSTLRYDTELGLTEEKP